MGWIEKSGFHNSIEPQLGMPGDPRVYDAEDFSRLWAAFFSSGIMRGDEELAVVRKDDQPLTVQLLSGFAMVRGYHYMLYKDALQEGDERLFTMRTTTMQRIDRLVLRLDTRMTLEGRTLLPCIKEGAEANYPVAPPLMRDRYIWEICLAEIHVYNNDSFIITDTRYDVELCGPVWFAQDVDYQKIWDQLSVNLGSIAEFANTNTAIIQVSLPQSEWLMLPDGQYGIIVQDPRVFENSVAWFMPDEQNSDLADIRGGDTLQGAIRFRADNLPQGDVRGICVVTRVLF